MAPSRPDLTLYSVGHSTHPMEEFVGLLRQHQIETLADIRSYPSSRRWPQFNQDALAASLGDNAIAYRWIRALGGRRRSRKDSPHSAWKVAAFRAYADYADTPEFAEGLDELLTLAATHRTAFMCAEGLWWQCHRRIVSDHLILCGATVLHILPSGKIAEHKLPEFATVTDGRIIYDGGQAGLALPRPS